jgi:hypothetical protein
VYGPVFGITDDVCEHHGREQPAGDAIGESCACLTLQRMIRWRKRATSRERATALRFPDHTRKSKQLLLVCQGERAEWIASFTSDLSWGFLRIAENTGVNRKHGLLSEIVSEPDFCSRKWRVSEPCHAEGYWFAASGAIRIYCATESSKHRMRGALLYFLQNWMISAILEKGLEKAWNDERPLCEEVAEGNR